jgi:hypothetical protein
MKKLCTDNSSETLTQTISNLESVQSTVININRYGSTYRNGILVTNHNQLQPVLYFHPCFVLRKERDSYLLIVRKMDMEMSPDTLEVDGVNELFVTVTVDESFTTEQTVSGSLGTHRTRSTN